MTNKLDWPATRVLVTLLSALLLGVALLLATAGVSRAEPPQPVADILSFSCDNGSAGGLTWKFTADLADKGRWVDFRWQVTADTGEPNRGTGRHDTHALDYANNGGINTTAPTTSATATIEVIDKQSVVASDLVTVTCAD